MKFSHHIIIGQTLTDLQGKLDSILAAHPQQQVVFKRFFLPDESLRQQFPAEKGAVSYIIQPVLCEGSVALWLVLCEGAQVHDQGRETILEGEGIRLIITASLTCPEGTSEQQTRSIFSAYAALLEARGLTLEGNCIRTWLFCDDIDHQYAGLVKARREWFAACGLTPQTRQHGRQKLPRRQHGRQMQSGRQNTRRSSRWTHWPWRERLRNGTCTPART